VSLSIDSSGKEHVVLLKSPTPGYQAKVVYLGEAYQSREVYVLIRDPDPLYVYSGVEVTQRIASGVDSSMPIRVLVQEVSYNGSPDREKYLDAVRSQPAAAPAR
jgi:hypothetical protein